MNKKEKSNPEEARNLNYEIKTMTNYEKTKGEKDKNLPWWVEFLFVQIGLPDKLLIKILKTKKNAKELIKNEKKSLMAFLFVITVMAYFYPVIKNAKNKLHCEANAKNYITKNKGINVINKTTLKMLSTNFCSGGKEIYEIENLKN